MKQRNKVKLITKSKADNKATGYQLDITLYQLLANISALAPYINNMVETANANVNITSIHHGNNGKLIVEDAVMHNAYVKIEKRNNLIIRGHYQCTATELKYIAIDINTSTIEMHVIGAAKVDITNITLQCNSTALLNKILTILDANQ